MAQDSKVKRDDCAVDIPETIGKEEANEAVIQPSLHGGTSNATVPKRSDSATIVEAAVEACSTAPRWYFKTNENAGVSEEEPTFECLREYQPPVKANASDRHTNWRVPMIDCEPGRYMIVLGISTMNVRLDQIESIAFCLSSNNGKTYGPSEIVTKRSMKTMVSHNNEVFKWALHQELHIKRSNETNWVDMEIRTSPDALSEDETGFFDIYYMEIHPYRLENDVYDPHLRMHQPFVWSIDTALHLNPEDSNSKQEKQIVFLAFSGNGNYIATLCVSGEQLVIDLWSLERTRNSDIDPGAPETSLCFEETPFRPKACAWACVPLMDLNRSLFELPYSLDVSWDAAQIALACYEVDPSACSVLMQPFEDTFGVFRYYSHQSAETHSNVAELIPSRDHLGCLNLKNHRGFGKFHITALQDKDPQKELYITCDGRTIEVYGVFRKWTHIRSIPFHTHGHIGFDYLNAFPILQGLRGKFFAWLGHRSDVISVWDIERGIIVSTIIKEGHRYLWPVEGTSMGVSNDGAVIALCREGVVTTHRTHTGTVLGSCILPVNYSEDTIIAFIHDDTQILVTARDVRDKDFGRSTLGLIVDANSLCIIGRFSLPRGSIFIPHFPWAKSNYNFCTENQTTIDYIQVQERLVQPYSKRHSSCREHCKSQLTPLTRQSTEFTTESGMDFRIITQQAPGGEAIIICLSSGMDNPMRTFIIPPPKGFSIQSRPGNDSTYQTSVIHGTRTRLLVKSETIVMIWDLPEIQEHNHDPVLLLTWLIPRDVPRSINGGAWLTCPHQQVYCRGQQRPKEGGKHFTVCLHVDRAFESTHAEIFLEGIVNMVDIYQSADETCKRAIIQYVSKYINSHPTKDPKANVLSRICQSWTNDAHDVYKRFVTDLLGPSNQRWIPRPESNPLPILLEKAEKEPRALGLVKIITDSCIRNARDENNGSSDPDPFFLSPFVSCLHDMLEQEAPLPDLTSKALRKLAYLPVRCRSFIIDYHDIAHPPEFRWKFWVANPRRLHECKDPILQLNYTTDDHDPKKDNFTRDLFVASFDWLWIYKDTANTSSKLPSGIQYPTQRPTWFSILIHLILHKCTLSNGVKVECHKFELEMLDNPALAALVEYKWNTFGYMYWAARFFFQCCFYLLVLTAVFLQVYRKHTESLSSIFIIIIILSVAFLWLEIIQFTKGWRRYVFSVYNLIDIVAFVLPLAGSIDQLLVLQSNDDTAGNASILSFSVLFISLHFLFELRVSRNVCQFVTIIIRIFGEIRVFFLIFTGGILAFAIAILHLLHSCTDEECSATEFPTHFYKAVSSTYFFMGGRYDSINDEMDSNNWAFHSMMIIYFFFTVILMLNVLIGLINLAFNDGDKTWRLVWLENRLRYIESAENLTFQIPGFRETYNLFPNEVYYSAIPSEVHKYFDDDDKDPRRESSQIQSIATPSLVGHGRKYNQWLPQRSTNALKDELRQEFKMELQEQLREQKEAFEMQTRMLQEYMSALISSSKV